MYMQQYRWRIVVDENELSAIFDRCLVHNLDERILPNIEYKMKYEVYLTPHPTIKNIGHCCVLA